MGVFALEESNHTKKKAFLKCLIKKKIKLVYSDFFLKQICILTKSVIPHIILERAWVLYSDLDTNPSSAKFM